MQPGAPPTVIVQGPHETIEAIRPNSDGSVSRLWRIPGRAMTCNGFYEGTLLADLLGDGSLCTFVGTRGPGDCARLAAIDADGRTVWYRDFEEFPGTPPPWNVPGLMYWQGGYFRDPQRMDVLVQLRRIGGETWLLDGRTGEPVWFRSHSTDEREFGRTWFTIFDFNRDGSEDVLTNSPDVFCVADGASGELLLKKHARDFVPGQGYFGSTVSADFLGDGSTQMLFSNANTLALLRLDGSTVWTTGFDKDDPAYPNFGSDMRPLPADVDGDERLELLVPGHKSGDGRALRCLDAATGSLKWQLPLPGKPTEPAVADIDGDGRDECVFTIGSTLYSVGATDDGQSASTEWSLALPSLTSSVAVADVMGNGQAQIVLSCADGYVYGLGAKGD
jgi:outer membrane protein assembly factor BamB